MPPRLRIAVSCVLFLNWTAACDEVDVCQDACKKISRCAREAQNGAVSSDAEPSDGAEPSCPFADTCSSVDRCRAKCIKSAGCDAITGADLAAQASLAECQERCTSSTTDGGVEDHGIAAPDQGGRSDAVPHDLIARDGGAGATGVVITELMIDPKAALDNDGEWIELFNPGGQSVDVAGWSLKGQGTEHHVIQAGGPVLVPAQGRIVLGRSTDRTKNGGVNVAYAYSGIFLANTADQLVLLDADKAVVDTVQYDTSLGFVIPEGASLSIRSPLSDKSQASNWCAATTAWPGSKGDLGTPGTAPDCP